MLQDYYQLTKPGMVYGNAVTLAAGFFLASGHVVHPVLFLAAFVGLSLVIASGCIYNNIMDRNIDAKMERTKYRAMVLGKISTYSAVVYGAILGIVGLIILVLYTNILTLLIALAGWLVYVGLYTPLKPKTIHATIIGSLAGVVPPVVGYTAVSGRFDLTALLLLVLLIFWQMPHFYSIGIRRYGDYAAASIPILPVKKGVFISKIYIVGYILAFIVTEALFAVCNIITPAFAVAVVAVGLVWLGWGIAGFSVTNNQRWARQMFLISLTVLLGTSAIFSASALVK